MVFNILVDKVIVTSPATSSLPKLICNKFVDKVKLASPESVTVLTVEFNCCHVILTLSMFVSRPAICPQAFSPYPS